MINKLIETGKFIEAYNLISNKNLVEIAKELEEEAIMSENISYYAFINFLNKDGNNPELHYICSSIAATGINHYKGGYSIGFFHIQKAIELDSKNSGYKAFALLYNDIPDRLLSDEVAKVYAKEVLEVDPNNQIAKEILERA